MPGCPHSSTKALDVSILVPMYNDRPEHINACLASCSAQTYPSSNVEVVVWCEASDRERISQVRRAGAVVGVSNLEVYGSHHRQGIGGARLEAARLASGSWVFLLDADDVLPPGAISTMAAIVDDKTAFAYGDHERCTEDLSATLYVRRKSAYHELMLCYAHDAVLNPLYSSVFISHGEFFRRKLYCDIPAVYVLPFGEKPPIWIAFAEIHGIATIKHAPKVVYKYRSNPNGVATVRESELLHRHELTFQNALRRKGTGIQRTQYAGRFQPHNAKHFALFKGARRIEIPYLDYSSRTLLGRAANISTTMSAEDLE